ncbi:MAG: hypothetical protein ACI9KE_003397 [Polyangiales bacterium]|jgi:hypothetical protein
MLRTLAASSLLWLGLFGCGAATSSNQTTEARTEARTEATTPTPATSSDVRWAFDWPDGLRAHVVGRRSVTRNGRAAFDVNSTWDMHVERNDLELVLTSSNYEIEPISVQPAEEAINAAFVIQMLLPSMRIGTDGVFRSMEYERTRTEVDAALEAAVAPAVRANPAWEIVGTVLQRQAVDAFVQNNWMSLVQSFVGGEMNFGEVIEVTSPNAIPIGGGQLELLSHYTAIGRAPCFEGAPSDDCIRVQFDSVAPPDQLRVLVDSAASELPGPIPLLRELRFEGTLITEPNTLVPHTMTLTKFVRAEMPNGAGEIAEEELREWRFQYDGR